MFCLGSALMLGVLRFADGIGFERCESVDGREGKASIHRGFVRSLDGNQVSFTTSNLSRSSFVILKKYIEGAL